jgi:hypothetical protein
MKNLKTPLMLLTIFTMAWLTGCASSPPERVVSNQGFRVDVPAICSAINESPEGKMNKKEFCQYFKDQAGAAETFDTLDSTRKGYVTEADVLKKQRDLDQVIRFSSPPYAR